MFNFNTLLEWHKKKFPEATYKSQLIHLAEEIREFNDTQSEIDELAELADVVIVLVSLRRFPETKDMSDDLLDYYYFKNKPDYCKKLMQAIEKKVEIINKRLYYWTGEDYAREKIYGA